MQPSETPLARELDSVYEHLRRAEEILRWQVEFGNPAHPSDPASVELAGSSATAHNGAAENVFGSWVEVEVELADAPFVCYHNLGVTPIAGQLNVRWLVFGIMHDGFGAGGASTLSVSYEYGDPVTDNAISLRLYSGGLRFVTEDHPVKITLLFIPAVRG